MYAVQSCPYCMRARRLLDGKGAKYTEIRVDLEPVRRHEMEMRSGHTSVPQIFIGELHVGGFDDLSALDAEGTLDTLLELPASRNF